MLVTERDAFRALDLRRLVRVLEEPLLVDLRNVYPAAEAERAGLRYVGIGKPNGHHAATGSAAVA